MARHFVARPYVVGVHQHLSWLIFPSGINYRTAKRIIEAAAEYRQQRLEARRVTGGSFYHFPIGRKMPSSVSELRPKANQRGNINESGLGECFLAETEKRLCLAQMSVTSVVAHQQFTASISAAAAASVAAEAANVSPLQPAVEWGRRIFETRLPVSSLRVDNSAAI